MTAKIFEFPVREPDNFEGQYLPALMGLPQPELMDRVFEVNFDYLGVQDCWSIAESVEFFTDRRYQDRVLVDVDNTPIRPDIRGLYSINLKTFLLEKINDEPLKHFQHNA